MYAYTICTTQLAGAKKLWQLWHPKRWLDEASNNVIKWVTQRLKTCLF